MRGPDQFIAEIVAAAPDRTLIGRIRMQKIAYLLRQLGYEEARGFTFSYHHYGPYSRDLDSAIVDAEAFKRIREERRHRQSDGASYSVFTLPEEAEGETCELPESYRKYVRDLAGEKPTVLELAATAHWLSEVEGVDDWAAEIRKRKGWKAKGGRLKRALDLLGRLGLPPAKDACT